MNIKAIRETALLTQKEFAEELGVSLSCVTKWEMEVRKPSFRQQRKILEFAKKHNIEID